MALAEPERRLRSKSNASGAGKLKEGLSLMIRSEGSRTHIGKDGGENHAPPPVLKMPVFLC